MIGLKSWTPQVGATGYQGYYAFKFGLDAYGEQDCAQEVNVLQSAMKQHCTHVMSLTKSAPCVAQGHTEKKYPLGYIAPEMTGDIYGWLKANMRLRRRCGKTILQQVSDGMACLHRAGYIHGDLKADNMFYKGLDENGCPASVVLADFGLSQPLNSQMGTYDAKYYPGSGHLVSSLFRGMPDAPKIRMPGRTDVVIASEVIDRCALLLFAYENFASEVIGPGKAIRQGGCGKMGVDRPYMLPTHTLFTNVPQEEED